MDNVRDDEVLQIMARWRERTQAEVGEITEDARDVARLLRRIGLDDVCRFLRDGGARPEIAEALGLVEPNATRPIPYPVRVRYEFSDEGDHPTYTGTSERTFSSEPELLEWAYEMSPVTVPENVRSLAHVPECYAGSRNDPLFRIVGIRRLVDMESVAVAGLLAKVAAGMGAKSQCVVVRAANDQAEARVYECEKRQRGVQNKLDEAVLFLAPRSLLSDLGAEKHDKDIQALVLELAGASADSVAALAHRERMREAVRDANAHDRTLRREHERKETDDEDDRD